MLRGMNKVAVGAQQLEIVRDAELGDERVNSAELKARTSAFIAQFGGCDVVVAGRLQVRESRESSTDLVLRRVGQKALEKLLKNQSRGHHQVRFERR